MQTAGLVRVTITTPHRRIDMALPEHASVAEILPGLLARAGEGMADDGVAGGGWHLRRADGTAFDLDRTLGAHRVRDGEILHLTPRRAEWPEPEYDDLVDAIATGSGRTGRPWGPRHTRQAGLAVGAVALSFGLVAVLRAGPSWTSPASWALAVSALLLIAGVLLARALRDAGAGAVLAAVALPFAFTGGGLLLAGDDPIGALSAGHLLLASAALLLAAVVGHLGVTAAPELFAGAATVGLLGVLGGWLATFDDLAGYRSAAVIGGGVLALSTTFAPLALRLGRVPMPVLPRSTADLVRDDPQPPLDLVHAAVARADALLTGMLGGAAIVVMYCQLELIRSDSEAAVILVALLTAGFLVRARLYPILRQRLLVLVTGIFGAGCLLAGPLMTDRSLLLVLAGPLSLAVAAGVVASGIVLSTRAANPYLGRIAEYFEILVMIAVVPVACSVLGLYGYVRGLGAETMASKRDQLQAYQFLVQRAISALVTRETDPEQPPFRRPSGAAFAGVALAIVALACVGVYGMIVPGGNNAWRKDSAVIVEKETGTRYVYLDGRLHPVANYTSALLLLGDHRTTERVSRDSLTGVPRGPRIGISDAPDALPGTEKLLTGSWSLCSAPASDLAGSRIEESVLLAGASPSGGAELADQALLVESTSTGDRFLVWRGHRHKINDYGAVGTGLALTAEPWARVGRAWLDVLPEGAPIGPLPVAAAGEVSTAVPGRTDIRNGMLLMVQASGGGKQHYLAERDALRPITELQYDVQRASSQMLAAYPGAEPKTVSLPPSLATMSRQLDPIQAEAGAAPPTRPAIARLRDQDATVCATFRDGSTAPSLTVDPALPAADPMSTTARRTATGTPLADRVHVPPGSAIVVEAMPSAQAPAGTLTVVTDMGRRYPLASPDVLKMLGYPSARPVRLPAGLVARLPEGPSLDPSAARRQTLGG